MANDWGGAFAAGSDDAMHTYDDVLVGPMFEPWGNLLLDLVGVAPGHAVLDVACGTGAVARLAAARVGPDGRVTACDFSAAMLAVARAKPELRDAAPIEYLEHPADAMAVPDAAFDAITCQQGLQFFPDKPAALAEFRRAARPGARLGVAVWCGIEECTAFAALAAAVNGVLGAEAEHAFRGGPWGMPDGEEVAGLVKSAGFTDVELRRRSLPVVMPGGPASYVRFLTTTGLAPAVAALDDAGRRELSAAAYEALAPMTQDDGAVHSTTASHIVLATA